MQRLVLNGPNKHPGALFVSYKLRGQQQAESSSNTDQGSGSSTGVMKRFLGASKT
ncbi:unnamed protein product [Protopolystoma xenopodis]|uniref:Uncharacterized protein n=1 Tax=Protopolystoma xenopodis TaxID=117903 RepID=A0A448XRV6_9PLAT|nr:unnamed protein product [Protopolystoma xenopodis]